MTEREERMLDAMIEADIDRKILDRKIAEETCEHCGESMADHDDGECPMPKEVYGFSAFGN